MCSLKLLEAACLVLHKPGLYCHWPLLEVADIEHLENVSPFRNTLVFEEQVEHLFLSEVIQEPWALKAENPPSARLAVLLKRSSGQTTLGERKKHININKFAGLPRHWVVAKILFMFFFFFSGHSLAGEKAHKQNPAPPPKKNPGTIPRKFCLCVFVFMCFFAPKTLKIRRRAF